MMTCLLYTYVHSWLTQNRVIRAAYKEASAAIKQSLPKQAQAEAQAIPIRNTPRQPLHPVARIRQNQSRWYSTSRRAGFRAVVRHFTSTAEQAFPSSGSGISRPLRSSYPKSAVSANISRFSGRAPFASTLRPNLTGGTLGRTAGGYSLGAGRVGGARFFSHGPASQAHVVQNVSQAVRAFFVSGQKAQFNGVNARGEKKYKAVTTLQEETGRKLSHLPKATPGSYLDFAVNPTITALTPLNAVVGYESTVAEKSINSSGLLDVLSVDFSRSLKDLAAVLNDLKKISQLGDLPITYDNKGSLRVHFPGCDKNTVESLCQELNVQRGVVTQDEDFDAFAGTEIALLFPFAPSRAASEADAEEWFDQPQRQMGQREKVEWAGMLTPSDTSEDEHHFSMSSARSVSDADSVSDLDLAYVVPEDQVHNPWGSQTPSTPSGYETLHYSSPSSVSKTTSARASENRNDPLEYQGFEGIYRFIEECDSARARR